MRSLVFDTETTGLIDFKARPPFPQRVIQLGAALYFERRLVGELNIILNTGVDIPRDSIAVHNITPELVEAVGLSPKVGVPMFNQLLRISDRLVAHNLDYDLKMMVSEYLQAEYDPVLLDRIPKICTKESTTDILKIPGKYGRYKWPSLDEAYRFLVDPDGFEGAHDAMIDVKACAAVLFALEDQNKPLKF